METPDICIPRIPCLSLNGSVVTVGVPFVRQGPLTQVLLTCAPVRRTHKIFLWAFGWLSEKFSADGLGMR